MRRLIRQESLWFARLCPVFLFLVTLDGAAKAAPADRTDVNVVVKDSETGQPVSQAHLTFSFPQSGRSDTRRSKWTSYSAKTNAQGHCKFKDIPKGTVHLVIIADRHQTFGKDFELEQDNQVIEVKLRKPQPLL